MPGKTSAKRYTTMRSGKFRNRHHRYMHFATTGGTFHATNGSAPPVAGHTAWHKGSATTANNSGTAFVGSTSAAKGTHHKATAGKGNPATSTKHNAPKSVSAKT